MTDIAIQVEGLGKRYRIASRQPPTLLRDALAEGLAAPWRFLSAASRRTQRSAKPRGLSDGVLWALREVSFELKRGEVLGLIGRNGAGKSTLLKLLARITEPTEGSATIRGRVGSLLEVGTGFHPELTGRENIYLSGSILGMKRAEIERQLDAIIAFAELEAFIETPVKRYSSGMYMRLAFAVAAHLDPEVLLVDEVLAVGDAAFQKKCLGKMEEISQQHRTVLFVSHNLHAVERLCSRVLLLDAGRLIQSGPARDVISAYLQAGMAQLGERRWAHPRQAPGDGAVRLNAVRICHADGTVSTQLGIHQPLRIEVDYWVLESGHPLDVHLYFYTDSGALAFVAMDNQDAAWRGRPRPRGWFRSICHIPGDLLNDRSYTVLVGITTQPYLVRLIEREALSFRIVDDLEPQGARATYARQWPDASVRPVLNWTTEYDPVEDRTPVLAPASGELSG